MRPCQLLGFPLSQHMLSEVRVSYLNCYQLCNAMAMQYSLCVQYWNVYVKFSVSLNKLLILWIVL
jgi:hypothetical protein